MRSLGWFAWKKGPLRAFLTKKHAKLIKDVSFLGKERRGIRGSFWNYSNSYRFQFPQPKIYLLWIRQTNTNVEPMSTSSISCCMSLGSRTGFPPTMQQNTRRGPTNPKPPVRETVELDWVVGWLIYHQNQHLKQMAWGNHHINDNYIRMCQFTHT